MKIKTLIPLLAVSLVGCTTALKSDKIVTVKSRIFGIQVGENPATQVPEVKFGFISTVYQMIPTSTNGTVYAPKYADYFDLKQGANPFNTGIQETTGTGDVSIGNADGTNTISHPAIPSSPPPIR